ncbi:SRPBCC family protein [Bosea sp. PAMC 26642]|uniref:SRPBCC family protein n=1 Tax=Bosea sp. (strain PAMC 26642) TaxID=1792307 RepID=UPI0007704590|nr:SRPBCC domain-containing protein [Bosea sp. PAMC 26642]AMJ59277.1 ATPase [Bosea sp. PAMC 26642]
MNDAAATTPSLTMKRRLNASPAEIYRAWTDPKLLARWFGPENVETLEAELDVRVGGVYRVVMLENTGERHQVSGTYHEVVENERLVFSWSWVTTPERVSRVTVTLKPDGDVTILTLLHEQLFDEQAVKGHTHGWTGSMVKLEELFA